jgi:valyl-tRNA synthetase
MLRPFPEAGAVDGEAEQDVDWIKGVVQGVRRVRSELNLPPGKVLDVLLQGGAATDPERQRQFAPLVSQLARIGSAEWVEDDAATAQCAVALVGDLKILLPLKGLVDVEEELSRLRRQLEREQGDLRKSEAKLGNSRFVDNAPEAVVEQERERLAAHRANVENLHDQIHRLEALRD